MAYYTAPIAKALRDACNKIWPGRDTGADGFIGDASHQSQGLASQHNPRAVVNGVAVERLDYSNGVVLAVDLDATDIDSFAVAEAARKCPHVLFVNWNWRVANGGGGTWRDGGADGPDHNHVSFRDDAVSATYDWVSAIATELNGGSLSSAAISATPLSEEDDMPLSAEDFNEIERRIAKALDSQGVTGAGDWSVRQLGNGDYTVGAKAKKLMVEAATEVVRSEGLSGAGDVSRLAAAIAAKLPAQGGGSLSVDVVEAALRGAFAELGKAAA